MDDIAATVPPHLAQSPVIGAATPMCQAEGGWATRPRLTVVATDEMDVVTAAGGLLFDRAATTWDITVYLAACRDDRALRILGVAAHHLDGETELNAGPQWPDGIVASARLYESDARVRNHIAAASRGHRTEVAIWGGEWPTELGHRVGRVKHQLSVAAIAFKRHAVRAAGAPALVPVSPTETFCTGKRRCNIVDPP